MQRKRNRAESRYLFGHMVVVAQSREIDMKQVLSHPLGPIPWALANGDGSLRKTDKAKFMNDTTQNSPAESRKSMIWRYYELL